ncbi:hypothetical protein XENORESO_014860, partial [Xenotaenia resolanae]
WEIRIWFHFLLSINKLQPVTSLPIHGQRCWEALIFCVKQSDSRQIRSPPRCLLFKLC